MTALQGSPRFTGFIRRLVEEGQVSAENMQNALLNAKKANQDIVPYLINELKLSPLLIAETISVEFAEPVFDISTYDASLIIREDIDEKLITRYRVLPIFKHANVLFVATSNPTNIEAVDAIRFSSKMNTETIIVEHHKLEKLIEQNFAEESTFDFDDDFDLDITIDTPEKNADESEEEKGEEAPIVKYINKLLVDAIRMGASDLHFEPYEKVYRVRYRVDGVLRQIATPPLQLANRLASRLKVMSQMDISEKRVPQDGRIKLKLSKNKAIDFRVNSLPTLFGEKLVLRILDPSSAMLGIDALGYEPAQKKRRKFKRSRAAFRHRCYGKIRS